MLGFEQVVIFAPEATYGAGKTLSDFSAEMTAHNNLAFNGDAGVEIRENVIRSGSLTQASCELSKGRIAPTLELSGLLTETNIKFLAQGSTLNYKETSPWTVGTQDDDYSCTFMRKIGDLVDIYYGCVLETLTITSSGTELTFTASYRAQGVLYDVDTSSWSTSEPVPICETSLLFSTMDVSPSGAGKLTAMTLTVTNAFISDDNLFSTNNQRTRDIAQSTNVELQVSAILETATRKENNILGTPSTYVFGWLSGWMIRPDGIVVSANTPDPEKDEYVETYTVRGVGANSLIFSKTN